MKKLTIYDPSMCCSTGVCGVDVDDALVKTSANVDWLKVNGANVERFNLSQQPMAFVENAEVKAVLESGGEEALPVIILGTDVVMKGRYPERSELAEWFGLNAATDQPAEETSSCCGGKSC